MSVLIKYCANCGDEFDNYGMIVLKDNEYKKLQENIDFFKNQSYFKQICNKEYGGCIFSCGTNEYINYSSIEDFENDLEVIHVKEADADFLINMLGGKTYFGYIQPIDYFSTDECREDIIEIKPIKIVEVFNFIDTCKKLKIKYNELLTYICENYNVGNDSYVEVNVKNIKDNEDGEISDAAMKLYDYFINETINFYVSW